MTIELTDEVVKGFQLAKVFNDCPQGPISSLEFNRTGELCVISSASDEAIILYDAVEGTHKKTVYSKKYGVGAVRFTHHPNNVLYASTKSSTGNVVEDEAIRYLSLHDNAYLRYFRGHESKVSALEMSPVDDTFISAAANDTIRLWDLKSAHCHGVLAIIGRRPLVAIDPQGVIFAVALESRYLRLYDLKSYERGPFACFEIVDPSLGSKVDESHWSSLQFSPDGKELLIGTVSGSAYVVDSFDGFVKKHITLYEASSSSSAVFETSYSPDGKYIISGRPDRTIGIWNRESGKRITDLEGHADPPTCAKFNPKFAMLASACRKVAFWLPDTDMNP